MPVSVKFGADTGELEAGVNRAKGAVEGFMAPVNDLAGSFDGLTKSIASSTDAAGAIDKLSAQIASLGSAANSAAGLAKGLLEFGAAGAAVYGVVELAGAFNHVNQEMLDLKKNADEAGLSLEQFQKLQYAANLKGVSDAAFAASIQAAASKYNELNHGVSETSKFLDANNVQWKNAAGEVFSFNDYVQASARLIANAGDGASKFGDQLKAANVVGFGREMTEVLAQGPKALDAIGVAAKANGAVLSKEIIDRDAEFAEKWTAASLQWSNAFKAAIVSLTPYVNSLIEQLKGGLAELGDVIAGTAKYFEEHPIDLSGTLAEWGSRGIADPAAAMASQKAFWQGAIGSGDQAAGGTGALGDSFATMTADAAKGAPALESFNNFVRNLGVDGYNAAVGLKAAAQATQEVTTAAAQGGGGAKTVFPEAADAGAAKAAITALLGAIQAANLQYQTEEQNLKSLLALHAITQQEMTSATLGGIAIRLAAGEAAAQKAMAVEGLTLAEKQRIENEKTKIEQQAAKDTQKANEQAALQYQQQWQSVLGSVEGAWNSQLRGLLAGTTSWSTAMNKIVGDLIIQMIESLEKFAVEKAAVFAATTFGSSPQSLIGGLIGGGGTSAATTANTTALTSLTTAIATHFPLLATSTTTQTTATTGQTTATAAGTAATTGGATATTANATATTANTGGLLTTAASWIANTASTIANTIATDAAAIGKMLGFAQGSWSVPQDMVAMIHQGEMIVPADGGYAEGMRAMLGGGLASLTKNVFKFDVGTDYVVNSGLAMIHQGEAIVPAAARGSGPFTGTGLGGGMSAADKRLMEAHEATIAGLVMAHKRSLNNVESVMDRMHQKLNRVR
jgi:hypothetical protein